MKNLAKAALAGIVGLMLAGAKVDAQNINVVINGQPVAFTGTPPQEMNGSVLVPLRGVFEQLGATVQYNPTTQTIFAQKGSTTVSLSLGSNTAYVDNQPQQLAQPPTVIVGTTLVPLRFVAEAFGAYVEWEAASSTVVIQTSPSAAVPIGPPPPPAHPAMTTIHGRIMHIDDPDNPHVLTVGTDNGPVQVNIGDHTQFTVRQIGQPPVPSAPEALHPGEDVEVQMWPNGNARSIEIRNHPNRPQQVSAVTGHIVSIDNVGGPSLITVGTASGRVQVGVDAHTAVTESMPGGQTRPAAPEALRIGDNVDAQVYPNGTAQSIQINLQERRGHVVAVQQLPNGDRVLVLDTGQTVVLDSHAYVLHDHHPTQRPIQQGDSVSIRLDMGGRRGYSIDIF